MYKIGDKVKLDNEMYIIKGLDGDLAQIINGHGSRIVDVSELTPYRTAHEKLIEMGWKLKSKLPNEKVYGIFEVRLIFRKYEDGLWRYTLSENLGVYKNFSYILTQYLEELEAIK